MVCMPVILALGRLRRNLRLIPVMAAKQDPVIANRSQQKQIKI